MIDYDTHANAVLDQLANEPAPWTYVFKVEDWSAAGLKTFLEAVVAGAGERVRGIRTTPTSFQAIGANGDSRTGGTYLGIPVAVAGVDFDTVEIVFKARIHRAIEMLSYGRSTGRTAYFVEGASPPPAKEGAEWRHDPSFDENMELRAQPGLKKVFDAAREGNGAVVETSHG